MMCLCKALWQGVLVYSPICGASAMTAIPLHSRDTTRALTRWHVPELCAPTCWSRGTHGAVTWFPSLHTRSVMSSVGMSFLSLQRLRIQPAHLQWLSYFCIVKKLKVNQSPGEKACKTDVQTFNRGLWGVTQRSLKLSKLLLTTN